MVLAVGRSTVGDAVGSHAAYLSPWEPRKGRSCGGVLHSFIQSLIQQACGSPTAEAVKEQGVSLGSF